MHGPSESTSTLLTEFVDAFVGYARWLVRDALHPFARSYVWLLVVATIAIFVLERTRPWLAWPRRVEDDRRGVAYALLNFFGFGLLGYAALSDVAARHVSAALVAAGLSQGSLPFSHPLATVAAYLVVRDLIEYFIHRLLHRVPSLWRIHAVHHAPTSMGVLVHLRYHPLETVVYRTLEFVPMWLLGFGAGDFFAAHAFALVVGHLNHANLRLPLGPLRYVLNSSAMHLVHHARELPPGVRAGANGVNFGLTLSLWDFVFGTAFVPDPVEAPIALGFEGVERYPERIADAMLEPFRAKVAPLAGDADGEGSS